MHALIAAVEDAATHELPIPAAAYGGIALAGLVALLLVTYAFRGVGSKH